MSAERQPLLGEPVSTPRGFLTYGGGPLPSDYGHTITVRESSAAEGPHVWLFIDATEATSTQGDPHLTLAQAIALRERLSQFIDGVPERWQNGTALLANAQAEVYGTTPPTPEDER